MMISTATRLLVISVTILIYLVGSCWSMTNCMLSHGGKQYTGTLSTTTNGHTCQQWASQVPQGHGYTNPVSFPDETVEDASNHCRNPDTLWNGGTWCYTITAGKRWDTCEVPYCECKITTVGHQYLGTLSTTTSGLTCQSWDSPSPHPHNYTEENFPDLDFLDAANYCRNPLPTRPNGPWCFTMDPNVEWEYCDVSLCDGYTTTSPGSSAASGATATQVSESTPIESTVTSSTIFTNSERLSSLSTSFPSIPTSDQPSSSTISATSYNTSTSTIQHSTSDISQATGAVTEKGGEKDGGKDGSSPKTGASKSGDTSSIGAGIVATIVIACVVVVVASAVAVWWRFFRNRPELPSDRVKFENFDNPLYNKQKGKSQTPESVP